MKDWIEGYNCDTDQVVQLWNILLDNCHMVSNRQLMESYQSLTLETDQLMLDPDLASLVAYETMLGDYDSRHQKR